MWSDKAIFYFIYFSHHLKKLFPEPAFVKHPLAFSLNFVKTAVAETGESESEDGGVGHSALGLCRAPGPVLCPLGVHSGSHALLQDGAGFCRFRLEAKPSRMLVRQSLLSLLSKHC